MIPTPDWRPFQVSPVGTRGDQPRSLDTLQGVCDRLRVAAFAEIQAREAFRWAASHFTEAPAALRRAWIALAEAEQRHLDWLLRRMTELGADPYDRKVSDHLWQSFQSCKTAREFALYMASAEEWGRKAGERFHHSLKQRDPVTSEIFKKIAEEEVAHIQLALRYFPDSACRLQ